MYQTYMMLSEVYFRNAHSLASGTEPEPTCSLYDVHLTYNNKGSGVLMNISKCLNNFSEAANKTQH